MHSTHPSAPLRDFFTAALASSHADLRAKALIASRVLAEAESCEAARRLSSQRTLEEERARKRPRSDASGPGETTTATHLVRTKTEEEAGETAPPPVIDAFPPPSNPPPSALLAVEEALFVPLVVPSTAPEAQIDAPPVIDDAPVTNDAPPPVSSGPGERARVRARRGAGEAPAADAARSKRLFGGLLLGTLASAKARAESGAERALSARRAATSQGVSKRADDAIAAAQEAVRISALAARAEKEDADAARGLSLLEVQACVLDAAATAVAVDEHGVALDTARTRHLVTRAHPPLFWRPRHGTRSTDRALDAQVDVTGTEKRARRARLLGLLAWAEADAQPT